MRAAQKYLGGQRLPIDISPEVPRLTHAVHCFAERGAALAIRVHRARFDVGPRDLGIADAVDILQRPCVLTSRA
jgi:hypothetical protein